MKLSKLTLAVAATLGASLLSSAAFAIDLYVDTKTKQIYAEPGKGRVLMGKFVHVDEKGGQHKHQEGENDSADIKAIKEDLELKNSAIKALEEKVVAERESRAKNDEKWFNKINLRGYTQLRYNQLLDGSHGSDDRVNLASVGDSSIGNNKNFSFRRVRLVFSGDINDYVSLYIQPDFASAIDSSINNGNFAQLRDAYADLHFDKAHEYRIRAGQSKVPFGWENLQSSQNRLALDRNDALNSAVPSERDLGLMAYWTPSHVQKLWKDLSKKGLKTSGDYGILGFGVYNGQGLNRDEKNDDLYMVAHATYPLELGFLGSFFDGQVLEIGADAMSGRFSPSITSNSLDASKSTAKKLTDNTFNKVDLKKLSKAKDQTFSEDRVAVHAILFPQPFGLQAEWNWGNAPTLDVKNSTITRQALNGGYVQAMYKIDNVFGTEGTIIPYVKWQKYDGAWKAATNAPRISTREIEAGVEYQIMKALEVTLAYSYMDRTNVKDLKQYQGDVLRAQLQWNY
jgi:hypothetical protein